MRNFLRDKLEQIADTIESRSTRQMLFAMAVWSALIVLSGMGTGCAVTGSSKVAQTEIYTSYSGSYNEATGRLRWSATFNIAGSTGTYLTLDPPSTVSLDGSQLSQSTSIINTVDYGYEASNPSNSSLARSYVFQYVNNDHVTFANTFSLPGRVAIGGGQGTQVRLNQGFAALWNLADTAQAEDQLSATIQSNASGGGSAYASASSPSGSAGAISFSIDALRSLQPGPATLQICRRRSGSPLEKPQAGGAYSVSYCSGSLPISVTLN